METKPVSILVIDGDAASRNYLSAMLKKSGYVVLSASLGREGLISAWRDQPDIVILDPALPDMSGLELVTRLRQDRRTAKVILVALSSQDNPQEMAALLAAGCNEYLVKSGQTLQKLMELLPLSVIAGKVELKKQGRLIVFMSAKGGTGTSSLCANIAMCLGIEMPGKKIALLDLVLPIGSIANIVGYDGLINITTVAMQGADQLTAAFFRDNLPLLPAWNFNLLAGSPDPTSANQMSGERLGIILGAMLESYDYVFVDVGRSLSRISLPILQKADAIALILSTDLATAELTLTVWKYLKAQGVEPQRVYAIQNRAIGLEGMTKAQLEKMTGLSVEITMPYMGDNLTVANNRHEPLASRLHNDSISLLLKQAATQMVEVDKHRNR